MTTDGMNRCRASVVVPARNRPDLLRAALAALTVQDLAPDTFEIVVCDDGSTDDIASVVAEFRDEGGGGTSVRLLRLSPRGPAAARNAGTRAARAAIVVFVDSDVEVAPGCVGALAAALERQPDWAGAEARLEPTGGEDGLLWDAPSSDFGGRYHTAAIAYRRSILCAVGGFDETFRLPACEDVELAVRVLEHGAIGFVPEAIAYHPRRRITAKTHLKWRHHWRYETILAVRYGILSFPGKRAGPLPRVRVLAAALVNLPAGRALKALGRLGRSPGEAIKATGYAVLDVGCAIAAAPAILFEPVAERQDYLDRGQHGEISARMRFDDGADYDA